MIQKSRTWQKVLSKMELQVSAVFFDLWISTLQFIEFKNFDKVVLLASSQTAKTQILKNHISQLETCVEQAFGMGVTVEILDPEEMSEYVTKNNDNPKLQQIQDSIINGENKNPFNPKYIFDNFVVGKCNQFVYAAARAVAEHPGKRFNPLFIYGGVGLGKTHLLHAIGNYIHRNNSDLQIMYVTCEKFTNDYISSLRNGNSESLTSEFREKYRNLDILMIDDIQFISNKTSTQEEFFHTFNDLYQNNKQIIISSDRPPKEISTLEERLSSRFTSGLIQDIQAPDFETKVAILQKKAQLEGYSVDDDVVNFIAEKITSNIRELEGLLGKVYFFATLIGQKTATIETAREAFKEDLDDKKEKIKPEDIVSATCEYFNISDAEIKGKKKSRECVEPRMIAIYLIGELLGIPLISIGKVFNRDHTTIIHARDKITEQLKTDSRLKTIISDIKSKLNF
ncbi:MAG: chromosomal replication initiator protein DnaA [Clostridia bacterium]